MNRIGLLVHANESAGPDHLERLPTRVVRDPEHTRLRPSLEAEPLDQAFSQRLDGKRGEESAGPLEEREHTHELEILLHQPRVLVAHAVLLKDLVDGIRERDTVEGLQDIIGRTLLHGVDRRLHVDDTGHHHDVLLGPAFLDPPDEFAAVDPGHHQVGDHDVEVFALEDVQRLFSGRGRLDVIALVVEQSFDQLTEIPLIVDCEYARLPHDPSDADPVRTGRRARARAMRPRRSPRPVDTSHIIGLSSRRLQP